MSKCAPSFIVNALLLLMYLGVSSIGAAATAPYPASQVITSMTWDFSTVTGLRKANGSDIWPLTWATDGNLYGAWGDGGGFDGTQDSKATGRASLGFARISGTPVASNTASYAGKNVWGQAPKFAENQATFGGKVDDMVSINGVLYAQGALWTASNCGCTDPTTLSGSNQNDHTLLWSSDLGKSWTIAPWKYPTSFGSTLQFGQNYGGAFDPLHVYYYYGRGAADPTHVYFRRALVSQMTADPATAGHFEYFTGLDSNGSPLWSTTEANATAIFTDPNSPADAGTGLGAVYDAALGRYIAIEGHGNGTGQVGFFEAPHPWGPWATIAYYSDWGGFNETAGDGNGMGFPSKWISSDGKTLWAVFSGLNAFDSFNVAKVVLTTASAAPQITAPAAGVVLSPGEAVNAAGSGTQLSWSATISTQSTPFASGTGASFAFTVPSNVTASQLIHLSLSGSGGSATRDFAITIPSSSSAVGNWKFDAGSGSSAADSSGHGNTGTLVNGPQWTAGESGDALSFSGGSDLVKVSGSGSLANLYRGGLTVSAWIKPVSAGAGSRGRIIDKDNNDVGWFFSMYGSNMIEFAVDQFNGTQPSRLSTAALTLNKWQHVAATWDGTTNGSNIHLYVNGVPADGTPVNGSGVAQVDATTPFVIGNRAVDLARGFAGDIDEVNVFNRVLTPAEVHSLAAGGTSTPTVTLKSVSTGKTYTLAPAQVGTIAYIDRTYTLTALSSALAGGTLIQGANDDKAVTASNYLQFSLSQAATLYVCYSGQANVLPAWLSDGSWTVTALSCAMNDGAAAERFVYSKKVPAGAIVLGGNKEAPASGDGNYSNYVVIVGK